MFPLAHSSTFPAAPLGSRATHVIFHEKQQQPVQMRRHWSVWSRNVLKSVKVRSPMYNVYMHVSTQAPADDFIHTWIFSSAEYFYQSIISFRVRKERMNPGDNPPQCRAQKCTTLRSRPTLNSGLSTQALMCSVHMCHILFLYQEWQWVSHVFLFSYLSNKLVYGLTGQIVPLPIENIWGSKG